MNTTIQHGGQSGLATLTSRPFSGEITDTMKRPDAHFPDFASLLEEAKHTKSADAPPLTMAEGVVDQTKETDQAEDAFGLPTEVLDPLSVSRLSAETPPIGTSVEGGDNDAASETSALPKRHSSNPTQQILGSAISAPDVSPMSRIGESEKAIPQKAVGSKEILADPIKTASVSTTQQNGWSATPILPRHLGTQPSVEQSSVPTPQPAPFSSEIGKGQFTHSTSDLKLENQLGAQKAGSTALVTVPSSTLQNLPASQDQAPRTVNEGKQTIQPQQVVHQLAAQTDAGAVTGKIVPAQGGPVDVITILQRSHALSANGTKAEDTATVEQRGRSIQPSGHTAPDGRSSTVSRMAFTAIAPTPLGSTNALAGEIAMTGAKADLLVPSDVPELLGWDSPRAASAHHFTSAPQRADLPPHIARQLGEMLGQASHRPVEIALSPIELGKVRMSIATEDGKITVNILAERPDTLDLMRRHIDQLGQTFRSMGYDQISFSFGHGATSRDQDGKSPAGQSTGTPSAPTSSNEVKKDQPVVKLDCIASAGVDIRL